MYTHILDCKLSWCISSLTFPQDTELWYETTTLNTSELPSQYLEHAVPTNPTHLIPEAP